MKKRVRRKTIEEDEMQDNEEYETIPVLAPSLQAGGKPVTVNLPVIGISQSSLLTELLERGGDIHVSLVDAHTLELVAEYLRHHKGTAPDPIDVPVRSNTMLNICPDPWDAAYIDLIDETGRNSLYNLTKAADYLGIPSLVLLCCAKIATLIKGKPVGQISQILRPSVNSANRPNLNTPPHVQYLG